MRNKKPYLMTSSKEERLLLLYIFELVLVCILLNWYIQSDIGSSFLEPLKTFAQVVWSKR